MADGVVATAGAADSRIMDFGSVFLVSPSNVEGDVVSSTLPTAGSQQAGVNIAELLVGRGFGTVVKHRDFEERSNYYDALLAAESRAIAGKKGIHSAKDSPVMHITDLVTVRNRNLYIYLSSFFRERVNLFFSASNDLHISGLSKESKRFLAIFATK